MTIFIIIAALMVIAPLGLLIYNFLRPHTYIEDAGARRRENVRLAAARLAAAQTEAAAPAAGDLPEYEDEVKAQLLADAASNTAAAAETTAAASGEDRGERRAAAGGIVLCALLLLAAPVMYYFYGAPQALLPPPPTAAETLAAADMNKVLERLQQRLAENPEDSEAVILYASSLMLLERYAEAAQFYARARALAGDEPALLISQLEALLADGQQPQLIEQTLTEAQTLMPADPFVLWLAGVWAQEKNDRTAALSYWRRASALVNDPQVKRQLDSAIAELEQETAAAQGAERSEAPESGAATRGSAATADDSTAAKSGIAALRVQVNITEELKQQTSGEETVFVFAKAAAGPPMPLAVHRARSAELPFEVVLDDSMAMTPAQKLSDYDAYEIIARISKSGDAAAAPGDLFGSVSQTGSGALTVTIDRQVR